MELELSPYEPGDERAIAELFGVVFERPISLDAWRWRYLESPSGPGVIVLAWHGDRLVGNYSLGSSVLTREGRFTDEHLLAAGLSMTTMVHPEAQGQGLFTRLATAGYEVAAERGLAYVYGFPNDNSKPGFVRRLGWADHGDLIELLAEPSHVPRAGSEVAVVPTEGMTVPMSFRAVGLVPGRLAHRRDDAYLRWRYADNPDGLYDVLDLVAAGEVVGRVAVKHYEGAATKLHLLDALIEPAVAVGDLLGALALLGQDRDAVLSAWCDEASPDRGAFAAAGFAPTGLATHLGGRALGDDPVPGTPPAVTMGDSDVF